MRTESLGLLGLLATGAGLAFGQGPPAGRDPWMAPQTYPTAQAAAHAEPIPVGFSRGSPSLLPAAMAATPEPPPAPPAVGPLPPAPQQAVAPVVGTPVTTGCETCGGDCCVNIYADVEALIWFLDSAKARVPLATTGPVDSNGIVGMPGTSTLFAGNNLNTGAFGGGRVSVGISPVGSCWGFEGSGFLTETRVSEFGASSDATGFPVLARPFVDATFGGDNARLVASPGAFAGTIAVSSQTRVWGAETNVFLRDRTLFGCQAEYLAGFRYFDLGEGLSISDSSTVLGGGVGSFLGQGVLTPSTTSVTDTISTRSSFYGAQVGARLFRSWGKWDVMATGKVALGVNHQSVSMNGSSSQFVPGGGVALVAVPGVAGFGPPVGSGLAVVPGAIVGVPSTLASQTPGGLLVPVNGRSTNNDFAVLPEFGMKVGYHLTEHLSLTLGYSVIYLDNTVRPAEQLASRSVNTTFVPTSPNFAVPFPPPPGRAPFNTTDFFVHGASVGLSLVY